MTWLGLLVTLGGFVGYFAAAGRFAVFQIVPWAFVAVMTLGVVVAGIGIARRPGIVAGIGAALTIGVFAFAGWYLFSYSVFDGRETRPAVGDPFPTVAALPTSAGGTFRVADAREQYLLLLFYRGSW